MGASPPPSFVPSAPSATAPYGHECRGARRGDPERQETTAGQEASGKFTSGPDSYSPLLWVPESGPQDFRKLGGCPPHSIQPGHKPHNIRRPAASHARDPRAGEHLGGGTERPLGSPPESRAGGSGGRRGAAGRPWPQGWRRAGRADDTLILPDLPWSPHFLRPPAPDQNRTR